MPSETSEYNICITSGHGLSSCKNCKEPMTGDIDADKEEFQLECINCGFKARFKTEDLRNIELETVFEG